MAGFDISRRIQIDKDRSYVIQGRVVSLRSIFPKSRCQQTSSTPARQYNRLLPIRFEFSRERVGCKRILITGNLSESVRIRNSLLLIVPGTDAKRSGSRRCRRGFYGVDSPPRRRARGARRAGNRDAAGSCWTRRPGGYAANTKSLRSRREGARIIRSIEFDLDIQRPRYQ